MVTDGVIKTNCTLCSGNCGMLVTVKNSRAIEVKADNAPLCRQGQATLEYIYHPERLTHPLKRVGERGREWQKISWDEALNAVAGALDRVKKQYGPESVMMVHGSAKGLMDTCLVRLANAFGTPNVVSSDHECHIPKMLSAELTMGFLPHAEYDHPPACIIVWGVNKAFSNLPGHRRLLQAHEKGTRFITVDPVESTTVKMSDLWLKIKPGTDLALALAMINVIISEGLYDKEFVDKWTVGFNRLAKHVKEYSPDRVSALTWIPADMIVKAAGFYATTRPAFIEIGNAVDQTVNGFQTGRAISILMAITGNIGVPGGEIEAVGSGFRNDDTAEPGNRVRGRWSHVLELRDMIPLEKRGRKVGADLNLLPDFRYITPQSVIKSILERKPYQLRAAIIQASNPLSAWCNIKQVYKALQKLEFLAVSDFFMTPTAALADIVLPSATSLEYQSIQVPPDGSRAQYLPEVVRVGECRSDFETIAALATRLGIGKYFGESADFFWNAVLEPTGLDFAGFKKVGCFAGDSRDKRYRLYEQDGFRTPSGKVEIYSDRLKHWGFPPLPEYRESPLAELSDEYPLLCTTRKQALYHGSQGFQVASLRKAHPDPLTVIHPETAGKLGIKEGDWLCIETGQGRIKQKASFSDSIDRRVVMVDSGWWFPEKGAGGVYGWADANYSALTDDKPPAGPEVGTFVLRGLACKVYRAPD